MQLLHADFTSRQRELCAIAMTDMLDSSAKLTERSIAWHLGYHEEAPIPLPPRDLVDRAEPMVDCYVKLGGKGDYPIVSVAAAVLTYRVHEHK